MFSEPYFRTSILPWHNLRANILLCQMSSHLPPNNTTLTNGDVGGTEATMHSPSSPSNGDVKTTHSNSISDIEHSHASTNGTQSVAGLVLEGALESAILNIPQHLMTTASVLPGSVTFYCLPLCFLNLWKIRAPCVQRCGFNLDIFDKVSSMTKTVFRCSYVARHVIYKQAI